MKKVKKTGSRKLQVIAVFVATIFVGCCSVLIYYSSTPINPAGKKDAMVKVDIPTGSGFHKVTEILNKAGLVKSRFLFYALAMTKNATRSIKAGEYGFSDSMTPGTIIDKLLRGDVILYKVTIPEDFTTKEVAERLMAYNLIDEKTFFDLAVDRDFLNTQGIKTKSIEGFLFPETYHFERSMSTRKIMKIMVSQFWKKVTPDMVRMAEERGFNINQFITFASIVGKESGNKEEKPMIAAVFYNRLKKGMPLQSDPTAVYDLKDFSGKVMRSHLKRNSPYNTYKIRGLPPGPIANPGIDSLNATLYPAQVNYLYFVSKKDGTHYFSSSLDMHNKATSHYRNSKRKN